MELKEAKDKLESIEMKAWKEGLTKEDYFFLKDMLYEIDKTLVNKNAHFDYNWIDLDIENLILLIEESNTILHDIHPKNVEYVMKRDSLLPLVLADSDKVGRMTGKNGYMFLCPYHNEITPSFRVKDFENGFFCFGCGCSGNVFAYFKYTQKMDLKEAYSLLQKIYLQKEEESDDKDHDLILKYQNSITSNEHIELLEKGRERLERYDLDFMPNSRVLVRDFYEDKFKTIERIKNKELDPDFKNRKAIERVILSGNTLANNEKFRARYKKLGEIQMRRRFY